MATTFVEYTGDGNATKQFTFPSYQSSDVKVRVDNVLKTPSTHYNITSYTTTGGGNIVFTSGNIPSSPAKIRIYRDTSVDAAKATFTAGSSVKAADLNNNTTQLLYRAQEEQLPNLIQTFDIADDILTTSKIVDGAVTTAKIADLNVTRGKIEADAIDSTKLADNAVNSEHYVDASIDHVHLANDIIDGDNIQDDVIDSEHYVAASIDTEHIADSQVTTAKIAPNAVATSRLNNSAVTTDKIANSNVTTDKLANSSVTTAKIANLNITTDKIAADAVTADKLADNSVVSANIVNDTIVNADIKSNAAIAGTKISPDFGTQNIATTGTVDGRDVSVDGAKLDTIETGATADQTNAEIRAAVEAATDSNVFTDADHTKLNGIETGATADQTNAEIKTAYEANANTNEFSDAEQSKLAGIETAATADQTAAEIKTLLQSDKLTLSEINTTSTDSRYFTETELTNGALDGRYYTETEAEARFLRQDSSETIASGATWSNSDAFVATTAAINARIIDLIDEVGGFTAITNQTSFPTTNPQGATGQAAILSIQATTATLTPSGTTITIPNGAGSGNTVTITGAPTIPQGFGFLVESTSTLHTYTFHRLVPIATQVNTVASNITNIVAAGTNVVDINNFADIYQISNNAPTQRADGSSLQEGDLWYDSANDNLQVYTGSAFAIITPSQSVLDDVAIVSGAITYQEDLGLITNAVTTGNSNGSLDIVADALEDEITKTVTVSSGVFVIDGVSAPALTLYKGWTYTFDQSDSSNSNHPFVFQSGGSAYTTNVTVTGTAGQAGAKVAIKIPESQPTTFRYYCSVHGTGMGNTITVKDDPIKTVSDNITDVVAAANNSTNVTAAAANATNINAVVANASNINAVAGNATNINAVAADATDIGAVAGKATEIGRLGTADAVADLAILGTTAIVSDMDTLADISSNITTVANNNANVTAVAGNASNINSAVNNASNINSVVGNASNINTVAGISGNVTTVAGISSNVTTVANNNSNVTAVAGKATEIGRLGTADAVADLAILGTTDAVADMNTLATTAIVNDMDTLADISSNITTVAGISSNVTTVANNNSNVTAVAGNNSNITAVANNASNINAAVANASNINSAVSNASNINSAVSNATNINTVASNISNVNNFTDKYQIANSNPTTDGGGNALAAGDLYFNTSANELRVYNGNQWQGGVTATGSLSQLSGNVFTGDNRYNDNIKAKFGNDSDLQIFHNTSDSVINASGTGNLKLQDQGNTKLEVTSTGVTVTGLVSATTIDGSAGSNLTLDFGTLS